VTELEVVHVTVTDGKGATGTGFTFSIDGGAAAMRTLVEGLIGQATIGSDLEGWDRRWHGLWARTHRLGRGVAVPALSAVDIAVWDLRARRAGLPLYRLLGAYRDQVPAYRSLDRMPGMSLQELVEAATTHVAEGFAAIKLVCGPRPLEEEVDRVAAVREASAPGCASWSTPTSGWTSRTRCGSAASWPPTTSPGWRSRWYRMTSPGMPAWPSGWPFLSPPVST
jgi:L-alanine-DL-glutamate epimerase-like enolase superfamily enzyme